MRRTHDAEVGASASARSAGSRPRVVAVVAAVLGLVAALACGPERSEGDAPRVGRERPTSAALRTAPDASALHLSSRGLYRVSLRPQTDPPPLQRLHAWILHVEDREGQRVESISLSIDGGMPQHGHGFPSKPRVTRSLGDGDYLIEGVQFNMAGRWVFRIGIVGPAGADAVELARTVGPGAGAP